MQVGGAAVAVMQKAYNQNRDLIKGNKRTLKDIPTSRTSNSSGESLVYNVMRADECRVFKVTLGVKRKKERIKSTVIYIVSRAIVIVLYLILQFTDFRNKQSAQ